MFGTVTRVMPAEGYGFIAGEDGEEFFFNQAALMGVDFGEMGPGVRVEFEVQRHAHGDLPSEDPRAVSIRLAPGAVGAIDNSRMPAYKVHPDLAPKNLEASWPLPPAKTDGGTS